MAAKRSAKTSGTGGASADGDAGEAAAPARRGKAGIPAGAVAVAVAPEGDEPGEGKGKGPTLRLGDLVSRVAAATGSKKKDTRAWPRSAAPSRGARIWSCPGSGGCGWCARPRRAGSRWRRSRSAGRATACPPTRVLQSLSKPTKTRAKAGD